ncbi:FecR family protein [Dyadobacter tibetensis]|uniref:FecR family protein n=1 Tax=Dyadobacter tibetensis TaxID=1211851 RepID=UPI000470A8E3|nr:FecR family protein [Dyadobacter tibetensis]
MKLGISMKEYKNYTLEDFLSDLEFQEWVLATGSQRSNLWNDICQQAPWQEPVMSEAQRLILAWRHTPSTLSEETKNQKIQEILDATRLGGRQRSWMHLGKWTAAASIIIMISLGYWWHQRPKLEPASAAIARINRDPQVQKMVNQSKNNQKVILPDSSRVELMPGAQLSYHRDFENGTRRDLELKGEAIFDVTHDSAHPFTVFTGAIVTRVLGTSFRINSASEEISVVVSSGKVKVFRADAATENDGEILLPNQKVSFSPKKNELSRSLSDDPGILTDLQKHPNFNFENTPLSEVLARMEKAYGIRIDYPTEVFRNCFLTVPLNGQSFYSKLDVICATIKATYTVDGNGVSISGKGCNPIDNQNLSL